MENTKNELKKHANDTGSIQVQIASLSEDIEKLTNHATTHKKDFSGKRGLLGKVSKRKRFLQYLKRTDVQSYAQVIAAIGLRK